LGHLDLGKLESVLQHMQNEDYYPTFEDKLTHLFFSACNFHCFQDGNKRIAITLCAQMLLLNGYLYCSGHFIREMENISYHVAAGNIDKDLLHEIITAVIRGDENDEGLKLKILHAIAMDETNENTI
jgi:death-on-curing protein